MYNLFVIADSAGMKYAAVGAGIFAALDSASKGGSPKDVAMAAVMGFIGFYDPAAPYGNFGETLFDHEKNINHLRQIDINSPAWTDSQGGTRQGFNWQEAYDRHYAEMRAKGVDTYEFPLGEDPGGYLMDDPAHDAALQLAQREFYEFLAATTDENSPAHYPMIEGTTGTYTGRDKENNPTDDPNEIVYYSWDWNEFEEPQIDINGSGPVTNMNDLNQRLHFDGFIGPSEYDPYEHPEQESVLAQLWDAWESVQYTDWMEEDDPETPGHDNFPAGAGHWCWVAREVYGQSNPRWLAFREWVLGDAPAWFRRAYGQYGPAFAEFLRDKPLLKRCIKRWMDSKTLTFEAKREEYKKQLGRYLNDLVR
jgi:hypothetical protein